jgi:hypothetical protein
MIRRLFLWIEIMKMILKKKRYFFLTAVLAAFSLTGCSYIQKKIDITSIKGISEDIMKDFHPGTPEKLRKLAKSVDISKSTSSGDDVQYTVTPLKKWSMNSASQGKIIEEKIDTGP